MATDEDDVLDVNSGLLRRRSISVRVHLAPSLYKDLDEISEGRGFPLASLMALIAGEFVERHKFDLQTRRIVALEIARRSASVVPAAASVSVS